MRAALQRSVTLVARWHGGQPPDIEPVDPSSNPTHSHARQPGRRGTTALHVSFHALIAVLEAEITQI